MRIFPSKIDGWLAVLLFGLLCWSKGSRLRLASVEKLLVLRSDFDTPYIVTNDHLKVICGPWRRCYSLDQGLCGPAF